MGSGLRSGIGGLVPRDRGFNSLLLWYTVVRLCMAAKQECRNACNSIIVTLSWPNRTVHKFCLKRTTKMPSHHRPSLRWTRCSCQLPCQQRSVPQKVPLLSTQLPLQRRLSVASARHSSASRDQVPPTRHQVWKMKTYLLFVAEALCAAPGSEQARMP